MTDLAYLGPAHNIYCSSYSFLSVKSGLAYLTLKLYHPRC